MSSVTHTCDYCHIEATQRCSQCKTTYYCSKEHQVLDWKTHKKICELLQGAREATEHAKQELAFKEHEAYMEKQRYSCLLRKFREECRQTDKELQREFGALYRDP